RQAPARGGTMHPGMHWWMRRRMETECRPETRCGSGGWSRWEHEGRSRWSEYHAAGESAEAGPSAFGVRRPLRFLAYKLGLDDRQVGELARILNALKTERAQADVDARRAMAGLADAVASATFDSQAASAAATLRVHSA